MCLTSTIKVVDGCLIVSTIDPLALGTEIAGFSVIAFIVPNSCVTLTPFTIFSLWFSILFV
jgi:hypothetical protein